MDVRGKEVIVCGAGKSGVAASNLLTAKGALVTLYDGNKELTKEKLKDSLTGYEAMNFIFGDLDANDVKGKEFMVLSPGISIEAPFVKLFIENNIPVWSEVELAYKLGKGRLCAITGTNGKTTTTTLVGDILKAYYDSAFVVGNIGIPYTESAMFMREDSVTVAEISSFQLESIIDFHPEVTAVLNVTPDHLNRHHTMEIYADTKMAITKNQTADEVCVLNYDDEITRAMKDKIPAKTVYFSRTVKLDNGVYLDNDNICLKENDKEEVIIRTDELKLLGAHNIENVMAAIAIAKYMGVPKDVIHDVIRDFKAVEHRIEYVATVDGVDYYNDSKGTNPDAAIKGIEAMVKPTYLIGGGYDKGVPFDDWIDAFNGKVRKLVLIGATKQMIAGTAKSHGFNEIIFADSLEEAVKICHDLANDGEAVLLSPACASWDMFDSYEQRGELFKEYVKGLE
ncbi:MAG: UDP-N-acetylmuramoyl-L-alanine--D-glutamate ligase [Lachnospiraceae bacterium]|nr:UDP-N-acetylmuramoyl-L-alanine--D-glutamate ligase [Lachnospiraceae bacterium]